MINLIILVIFSFVITIVLFYFLVSNRFNNLVYCRKIDFVIRSIIFIFYLILIGSRHYVIHISYQLTQWGINYAFSCLPIGNISPLTFTLLFVSIFLPKKMRDVCDGFVLCVSLVMPIATILTCVISIINSYPYHFSAIFDVLTHLMVCGLSIYLYHTKQIKIKREALIKSYVFIYSVVAILVIFNIIFKVSFFGLGFHDNWNIYDLKLFNNAFINLFMYCLGLAIIMLAVFMIYWFREKLNKKTIL